MKILELKVLRGPNFWSIKKCRLIQMLLDLEELEYKPSNEIPGFSERIEQLLPGLYEHECSEGRKGGFFQRVKDGTWMGHIIEHIALELQIKAGIPTGFGRTRSASQKGQYYVVFSYGEEQEGLYTAQQAVACAEALIKAEPFSVEEVISHIRALWMKEKLGPSTAALVDEAQKRNIPYMRLDQDALVQLGYGCKQKRIEATLTANTNSIAVDLAGDKHRTKKLLEASGIPVPFGATISKEEELEALLEEMNFPLVIKPLDSNHGNGATTNIQDVKEVKKAFEKAKKFSAKVIVEQYITGKDFRVLVINGKFVAAALRTPACVMGDGRHTVRELIDKLNSDPKRGDAHDNILTKIIIDNCLLESLSKKGYDLDTVLPMGEECILRPTANLSTGGTARDVTDEVHPFNKTIFERVARIIGLDVCGIDVMAPDLSTPFTDNGGAVIEVNAAPGFRMHLEPSSGKSRNVAAPVMDMLFSGNGRIPIVAITGTNGKTTTTRLVAHIAKESGCVTGYTTTDGIYIDNELVANGDCSGPSSARIILQDPSVEFAVLETARGGMLRSGLGYDLCDTAIVTNVAEDHLGKDGIDTIEKLARVKSIVPESVSKNGYAILNADDDLVYAMKDRVKCKVALFSLYSENFRIESHCNNGGIAAYLENGFLILRVNNHIIPIEEVKNVPISFEGKCDFNIANVLAATLAAYVNRIRLSTIRQAIRSFVPSHTSTPGRLNMFHFQDYTVMVDYAHNPHGVKALGKFLNNMDSKKKVGIITGVGDRRDEDIISLGEEAARIFDEIIIRHDEDLRGRTVEEIEGLVSMGIAKVREDIPLTYSMEECEAVLYAMGRSEPGTLIVVLTEKIRKLTDCLLEQQQKEKELQKAV